MKFLFYLIKRLIYLAIYSLSQLFIAVVLIFFSCVGRTRMKKKFIFGSTPLINNKYWAKAICPSYESMTIMKTFYNINNKKDFDYYFIDFVPKILRKFKFFDGRYFAFIYVILNARVLHTSFDGFALSGYLLEKIELILLRGAKVKIIILPYGGDVYIYSAINDLTLRNVLIASYPKNNGGEEKTIARVKRGLKYCDIFLSGAQYDGIHHWSTAPFNMLSIDVDRIEIKDIKNCHENILAVNEEVIIVHAPNHRMLKGTEFLIDAVKSLKKEGYKIDFIILERMENNDVLKTIRSADIFVDQLVMGYYGLAAIEGMASGVPVICNLENREITNVFRRYSFLNECPIVSATPETIADTLRVLITHAKLREELGRAGRHYVEKYHSYKTAQYMFGAIYDKIIHNKDVDLMNLFHPLLSAYNCATPCIQHPLKNNKLPKRYFKDIS